MLEETSSKNEPVNVSHCFITNTNHLEMLTFVLANSEAVLLYLGIPPGVFATPTGCC